MANFRACFILFYKAGVEWQLIHRWFNMQKALMWEPAARRWNDQGLTAPCPASLSTKLSLAVCRRAPRMRRPCSALGDRPLRGRSCARSNTSCLQESCSATPNRTRKKHLMDNVTPNSGLNCPQRCKRFLEKQRKDWDCSKWTGIFTFTFTFPSWEVISLRSEWNSLRKVHLGED